MSIDTDYAVLRQVLVEYEPTGWAAEFGVYSGYSLGLIAAHMPVIGFDSFEGLPEDWREGFPKGTFDMSRDYAYNTFHGDGSSTVTVGPSLPHHPNAMIVPGWFENTLPTFPFPPLGLVHIDCDLYSSAVTALKAVRPYIGPGTIVVFDEYHGYDGWEEHEAKAWAEFMDEHPFRYSTIAHGDQERAFRINGFRR